MTDLEDLYQEVILDHNRNPRNFRELPAPAEHKEGYNPLCGDRITVYVEMDGDVVRDVGFRGSGCAISQASASVMTTALRGKTRAEVESMFEAFHGVVTGESDEDPVSLGEMGALAGVQEFPTRVKCATLAWHTLRSILAGDGETTTTE